MFESLSTVCRCFGYIDEHEKKTPLMEGKLPRIQTQTSEQSPIKVDEGCKKQCKKHEWVSDKESSIIIIGGGVAGIHMASILIRHGFHNIQIMESKDKNENGYGKTYSIIDTEYEIIHELGTAYVHRNYDAFFELIGLYDDSNNELIPINNLQCNVQIDGLSINKYTNFNLNEWINNDKNEIYNTTIKYIGLYKEIFGNINNEQYRSCHSYQFPLKPINEIKLKLINMSFLKFINKYKLNALIPYFVYNQSLMEGFGNLDEIPAFYGLLWNSPSSSIKTLIDNKLQKRENLWCLKKGFEHLFKNIILSEDINIEYSSEITSINRYLNDKKHKICVMYNDKKEQKEKLIECDVLFCSSNISNILPLISDGTEEEKKIFKSIKSHTMCITLFEADIIINNNDNFITFYPNNLLKKNGHVFKIRNSSKIINGTKQHYKIIKQKKLQKERFISYQMINKDKNDLFDISFEKILLNDLNDFKDNHKNNIFKNVKIIKQNIFRYMPHWNRKDINRGIPWFVKNELQGKHKNMYYIGSSVCFQSIESILQYNIQLQHSLDL